MSDEVKKAPQPDRNSRGQFAKGHTGNPAGRPYTKRRLDIPSQLGRDAVELGAELITTPGPNGPRTTTKHQLVLDSIWANAVKGKAAAQKLWVDIWITGATDLLNRQPSLGLADTMRQLHENPQSDHSSGFIQAVDELKRRIKRR